MHGKHLAQCLAPGKYSPLQLLLSFLILPFPFPHELNDSRKLIVIWWRAMTTTPVLHLFCGLELRLWN